ncbi:hypothetical protein JIN78_04505 [Roseibacillus ishigakijimensis]|uniref:Type II toxin-antitoxin system RelE/ParE family toxin n=1 Tax=Roseibacillus ishigakijimensis TaxID=454146 RepID=A0A934VK62_9BACT|nr:hypothetical protein [Roseibacillus ishigakijimensis]MBK1833314.1 hypothetical protein [Roseibacillus ishigakijimensis]
MSRTLLYHSAIQREIRGILNYYEDISEQLADDFWDELTSAFDYARRFPFLHHFDPSGRRRCNLKRFPYHFLFLVTDLEIKVTVVRHNSRNPDYGALRR